MTNHTSDPTWEQDIDELLREYIFLKGQVDELEPRLKAAKAEILARTPDDATHAEGDQYSGRVVTMPGRETIAWDEVPEYLKEMLDKYKRRGEGYRYLRDVRRK